MQSLFAELKRRNVIRVGAAYLITAWLLAQVADLALESFGAPDWVMKTILMVLLIGFPLALIFAWAFELTPEGVKRDSQVDHSASDNSLGRRQLDRIIIIVLVVAVAYFALDRWVLDRSPEPAAVADATVRMDKSIAVLPFENRSSVAEDSHFVDGIQDDILTQLSKLSGLDKVISRTSVERYRDTLETIPEIGKALGVATILEGGVQRSGKTVRITVQLIEAATDKHLWSETFDRELTAENLFAVQSQISTEIARLLQVVMTADDKSQINRLPTSNLEAYNHFVAGRESLRERTAKSIRAGLAHFRKAVELDPEYSQAHVGIAESLNLATEYGGVPRESVIDETKAEIARALELDPSLGEAYAVSGVVSSDDEDLEAAEANFKRAIQLSPNYPRSYHWYALRLRDQGRLDEALPLIQKARALDPEDPTIALVEGTILQGKGDLDQARQIYLQGIEKRPDFPEHYSTLAGLFAQRGKVGMAARIFAQAYELNPAREFYAEGLCEMIYALGQSEFDKDCPAQGDEVSPAAHLRRLRLQGKFQEAAELARSTESASSDAELRRVQVLAFLLNADWQAARQLLEVDAPEMFLSEPVSLEVRLDAWKLLLVATTLRDEHGWTDLAREKADQVLQNLSLFPGGWDFVAWWAHGIRGDMGGAITRAHRNPKRDYFRTSFILDSPLFQQYFDMGPDGEAFLASFKVTEEQKQWYRDHRDKPFNLDDYRN